jgi:AAA15 family ATPase/GTPase
LPTTFNFIFMENQAYISQVHLKGYKSIRDMSIDLLPGLNIIIGPNGSGKTNFLDFLDNVFHLEVLESKVQIFGIIDFIKNSQKYSLNYSVSPSRRAKDGQEIKIIVTNSKGKLVLEHEYLKIGTKEIYKAKNENIDIFSDVFFNNALIGVGTEYSTTNLIGFGLENDFGDFFDNAIDIEFYQKYVNGGHSSDSIFNIIGESKFTDDNTKITHLSVNTLFLNILNSYSLINSLKFDISDARIIQRAEVIHEREEDYDEAYFEVQNIKIKFLIGNQWLDWRMLSDGTKRVFFLLYNVFILKGSTILLEEPELGIHPDQLYKLMDFLKEQSKEKQIIITTHSPLVLNFVPTGELDRIIVTKYDAEKGTTMHRMNERQMKKANAYMNTEGLWLSDYWVHSDLENDIYETTNEKN